jgi:hypothetical protein
MKSLNTSKVAGLVLRPFERDNSQDLSEIVRIEREGYPDAWDGETFLDFLDGGSQCLIAQIEDKVVGFILYAETKTKFHIEDIAVEPGCTRLLPATRLRRNAIQARLLRGRRRRGGDGLSPA